VRRAARGAARRAGRRGAGRAAAGPAGGGPRGRARGCGRRPRAWWPLPYRPAVPAPTFVHAWVLLRGQHLPALARHRPRAGKRRQQLRDHAAARPGALAAQSGRSWVAALAVTAGQHLPANALAGPAPGRSSRGSASLLRRAQAGCTPCWPLAGRKEPKQIYAAQHSVPGTNAQSCIAREGRGGEVRDLDPQATRRSDNLRLVMSAVTQLRPMSAGMRQPPTRRCSCTTRLPPAALHLRRGSMPAPEDFKPLHGTTRQPIPMFIM
jgi:hypothetical protein